MHKLTLHCSGCGNSARLQPIEPTTTVPAMLQYCPFCGLRQGAKFVRDLNQDQYELIAENHKLPVEAIKELMRLWDYREYPAFADWVNAFKAELRKEAVS